MSSLTEVSLEDFLDLYKEDILAHWDISEWNDFETSSKLTITCMVDFNRRRLGTMSRDMLPAYKKYGKKRREKTRDKYFYDNPFNRIHGFIILEDMTDKKNIPKDKKVLCISYVCSSIYSNHKGVGKILIEYAKKYDEVNRLSEFGLVQQWNIQWYRKGGGFKEWHNERAAPGVRSHRVLVFMTFLKGKTVSFFPWI